MPRQYQARRPYLKCQACETNSQGSAVPELCFLLEHRCGTTSSEQVCLLRCQDEIPVKLEGKCGKPTVSALQGWLLQ